MYFRTLIRSPLNSNNQNLKITAKEKPVDESTGTDTQINWIQSPNDKEKGDCMTNNNDQTKETRFINDQIKEVRSMQTTTNGVSMLNTKLNTEPNTKNQATHPTKDQVMVDNTNRKISDQDKKSLTNEPVLPEPNYTQIPNVIFDYWMQRLSPAEFKVLLCICRKTFGWHKTTDSISRNQIMQCTGLSRQKVKDAIDELQRLSLLIIAQENNPEKGHLPNRYQLNIYKQIDAKYSDPEDQKKEEENGGGRLLTSQGVGYSLAKGLGYSVAPQKKDNTKEKLTKRSAEPDGSLSAPSATDVFVFFLDLLKKRNPKMIPPNRKNWIADIDKIMRIDKRTLDELKSVLSWAFNQDDDFWPTAIQSPATLRKLFDRAWAKMNHKSKDKREKEENAQKLRRIEENKQWATTLLGVIRFRDTEQIMNVFDGFVAITNGKEWTPIGFAETNFKKIILTKLRNWNYLTESEIRDYC